MTVLPRSDSRPGHVSTVEWGGRVTRAEVDLDVIKQNVRALRQRASRSDLLVVVKADGYGHGSVAIGRAVLAAGAARLGVYTVDEGVALREAGIGVPILVFGPFTQQEAKLLVEADLTATIGTVEMLDTLVATSPARPVPCHIKLDTGLTRNGVEPAALLPLVRRIEATPSVWLEGIFTHFARSDEADKRSARGQFTLYQEAVAAVEAEGFRVPIKHTAASGAVHDLPETYLDMVRCGISVYGYYPSEEVSHAVTLRPALSLLSAVSRYHVARAGTGVGYGHEFVCRRDTPIALVPIGYGDGLPRTFGRGNGTVLIRGHRAPVVARVSMDQITIDVSGVPDVEVGDEVVLIGRQGDEELTADDMALATGTINYDILCGIMPRVPRLYTEGGRLVAALRTRPAAPTQLGETGSRNG